MIESAGDYSTVINRATWVNMARPGDMNFPNYVRRRRFAW